MTSGPRVCTSCKLAFRTPAQHYRHIRQKHRATFCARCVAHFPTPEAKEAHLRESDHHNQCPLCSSKASFFSRANLERHMVLSHPGCGVCGQRFRTVDERNAHEASHPSCRICQVVLPDINAIDDHEASEHFKCHYCGRLFDSHSNLVNVGPLPNY
jgi:DNA-directed RNA polymerase subunit RPC12/RpoP